MINHQVAKTSSLSRQGMVLFVVMGGIFVLTILVMSYNHLVQGKFNESREILKHLQAMKTAQAVARFITCKLKADLGSTDLQAGSPGAVLRKAFQQNDPAKIQETVEADWLLKILSDDSFAKLKMHLLGQKFSADATINAQFSFHDLTPLNTLKKGDELFLDFEKAGLINLEVTVNIGKTREVWQESRPFRVVVPFPMPLTKFTMYLRAAADASDPMKFNTVKIDSPDTGNVAPGSPRPLVLFNGAPGENNNLRENIWEDRGWVYLGGGKIALSRAGGHRNYGQGFYSYFPESDKPITLLFNYDDPKTSQKFQGIQVGSRNLIFSVARWGFSNALFNPPFGHIWKTVLTGEFAAKDPLSSPRYWNSSCLHLFGSSNKELVSMTRVVGDIEDRFLEICYLADASTRSPVGAVISLSRNSFETKSNSGSGSGGGATSNLRLEDYVCFSVDYRQVFGLDVPAIEVFFLDLNYNAPGNVIGYKKIMSKVAVSSYDETYDMIAQYSQNSQKIDIPPAETAPKTGDMDFKFDVMGTDCRTLKIDKLADSDDPTLGMSKRVCYEIQEQGAKAFQVLRQNFCMSQNSDFNLTNAVVRIKTGGAGMEFGDNLGSNTGGSILVDGPVKLGTFRKSSEPDKAPLLIMAEKGAITVKNSTHPTLAYLVALEKTNGTIKFASQDQPMNLLGGIAAHTIMPDDISKGGSLIYNTRFDPTKNDFAQHVGVVIGPLGGLK